MRADGQCAGAGLAAAWSGLLAYDIIIFFMTLYKTLALGGQYNRTITNVLLRDGASRRPPAALPHC